MAPNLHNSVLSEGFETNKKLGKNHNLNTVRPANIALAADEYSTEDALFFQSSDFHADSYNSMK